MPPTSLGQPTIQATFYHPQLRYGATPITIAFRRQAVAFVGSLGAQRGANLAADGRSEVLFSRIEEAVRVELICEPEEYFRLEQWFRDSGGPGEQFEFWGDRVQGSCWLFEDSLLDQNRLPLVLSSGDLAFADTARGRGVVLSGTQHLTVDLAQGTDTGFDHPLDHTKGVVVLDFVPAFDGDDGNDHFLLQTTGSTDRLTLFKDDDDLLTLQIRDGAGDDKHVRGAVSWSSGTRVVIAASWTATGTLALYVTTHVSGDGATMTWEQLTSVGGSGTGIMSALPTTLYVGADNGGLNRANGTYDTLMFQKHAFGNPHLKLAHYRPMRRNYFPYAELTSPTFEPQVVSPSVQAWRWPLLFRAGVQHEV